MLEVGQYYITKDGTQVFVMEDKLNNNFLVRVVNSTSEWWADEKGRFIRIFYDKEHCCDIIIPYRKYRRSS